MSDLEKAREMRDKVIALEIEAQPIYEKMQAYIHELAYLRWLTCEKVKELALPPAEGA